MEAEAQIGLRVRPVVGPSAAETVLQNCAKLLEQMENSSGLAVGEANALPEKVLDAMRDVHTAM